MKSKRAQEFIEKNKSYFEIFRQWIIPYEKVIESIELAESEMRGRAIEAFCESCLPSKRKECNADCAQFKQFITALDNPKTK